MRSILITVFLALLILGLFFGFRISPAGYSFLMRSPSPTTIVVLLIVVLGVISVLSSKSGPGETQPGRESGRLDDEEARILEDIHRCLSDLEKRVENLETLLISGKPKNNE